MEQGTLVIDKCKFMNNFATPYGGAIFIGSTDVDSPNSVDVIITDSVFFNNNADLGGGIYFTLSGKLDVDGTLFDSNQGGAIYILAVNKHQVINTNFTGNSGKNSVAANIHKESEVKVITSNVQSDCDRNCWHPPSTMPKVWTISRKSVRQEMHKCKFPLYPKRLCCLLTFR